MVSQLRIALSRGAIDVTGSPGQQQPSGFRTIVTPSATASQEDVRKAIRTGVFPVRFFKVQPTRVRSIGDFDPVVERQKALAIQKLAPGTIRALGREGGFVGTRAGQPIRRTPETFAQRSSRLAAQRRFGRLPTRIQQSDLQRARQLFREKGGPLAVGVTLSQLQSPVFQEFNVLFTSRIFNPTQIDVLSRKLDIEGRKLDNRIQNRTATQSEINKFNVLINQFNKQAGRTEAKQFREFFADRPSPRKPVLPKFENLGDITLDEIIGKAGLDTLVKSASEFGDIFVDNLRKLGGGKKLPRTREALVKRVGQGVGLGFGALDLTSKFIAFNAQEEFKNRLSAGPLGRKLAQLKGIPIPTQIEFVVPRSLSRSIQRKKDTDLILVTNPLKFTQVGANKFVITPRAFGESIALGFDVILAFSFLGGKSSGKILKVTSSGKPIQTVASFRPVPGKPNIKFFEGAKVKDIQQLNRISRSPSFVNIVKKPSPSLLRSIVKLPEFKALKTRIGEDVKAIVGAKKTRLSKQVESFITATNKELRPFRKKLGPIIKELKLSQKGLSVKKISPTEQGRLTTAKKLVVEQEGLKDARLVVLNSLRDKFFTRNIRKKFGPVIKIIKLGENRGLSPSGSVLRFARKEVKAFIDPRVKILRAVGIDINTFRLNLIDDLIKALLPRKLIRSIKKRFPELSKRLAIGKKRGVRKRVIVGRLVKKKTITILNRTFLNQTLALKFLRLQFRKEIKEVIGLFRTLSNVSKAGVRGEYNKFLSATRLLKKILKQPNILLTNKEIVVINNWNNSRLAFIVKVEQLFGKKIPRKIRKSLGPAIKTIKLSEKESKAFVKRIKASNSLLSLRLRSLFSKLSSDVRSSVRKRHVAALQRSFNTRQTVIKFILGKQIDRRGSANLLRSLNNDIERLKQAEIEAFKARTRAINAKAAKNTSQVRLATKQEQTIYLQAIANLEKTERRVRQIKPRVFKDPKPGRGEQIIKTKTGTLQIVKVKTRVTTKVKTKVKAKFKSITIIRPRAKIKLNVKVKARAIQAATARGLTEIRVRFISKVKTVARTTPRAALKPREVQRVVTKPKQVQIFVTRITPKRALRFRARQRIGVRTREKLRTRVRERLRTRLRPLLIPIPDPKLTSFSTIARLSGPLDVVARIRGKLRKINPVPLSGSQALAFGGGITDNRAIASFGIVKGKGKVQSIRVGKFQARKFRKPKGNTKLQRFLLVEKSKFRIDSAQEKREITQKGLEALRLRKRKKKSIKRKKRKRVKKKVSKSFFF